MRDLFLYSHNIEQNVAIVKELGEDWNVPLDIEVLGFLRSVCLGGAILAVYISVEHRGCTPVRHMYLSFREKH